MMVEKEKVREEAIDSKMTVDIDLEKGTVKLRTDIKDNEFQFAQ